MAKCIIPLAKIDQHRVGIPTVIYDNGTAKICLKKFTKKHIEEVFGHTLRDYGNNFIRAEEKPFPPPTLPPGISLSTFQTPSSFHIGIGSAMESSKLQFYLEEENDEKIQELKDYLDFAMRCTLHRGVDYMGYEKEDGTSIQSFNGHAYNSHGYKKQTIKRETIWTIKNIIENLHADGSIKEKIVILQAFLKSAMIQPGARDVGCILYFSLLESIYIQDSNPSEKTYKLATRLTVKLGKEYKFLRDIKKLYDKRSKVVHGTRKGNVFTKDDEKFLLSLSTESILKYIKAPEEFNPEELDTLLIR